MFNNLQLPRTDLKITKRGDHYFVWDIWRKKQIQLTPEEWVRQHLLHHLKNDWNYPQERIAVEMSIEINNLKRRCDAVVFDLNGQPQMIIECKKPDVHLNENVIHQIAQYNAALQTQWLLLSNGLQHFTLQIQNPTNLIVPFDGILDYRSLQIRK